ncbi:MAG: hypothetical protein KBT36_04135, partial [Kurthia sp.]|nr:hypothetical protein [Candidatus Kurthia equi]
VKMNTIESLNANCNTYVRELNQTINFKKDGKVIKMYILKVYKKGTKRVFFAAYNDEFKKIGSTFYARKHDAVTTAKNFANYKFDKMEEEPKKLHKFRTRTMDKMLNDMQTKGFAKAAQYDGYIKDFKEFYGVDTYVNEYYELKLVDEITKTLTEIKNQIGLDLKPCDHFTGVREFNGKKYFNIMLETRVSESLQYQKLLSFGKYKLEPNGFERVSIFF